MEQTAVRPLAGLENWFAKVNTRVPTHFVFTIQFSRTVSIDRWTDALVALVLRHPMLRVRITEQDGNLVFCEHGAGSVRFTYEKTSDRTRWQRVLQELMSKPLGLDKGHLVHMHLLQGEGWCDLAIAFHHAIADGIGAAFAVRDLLRALDGHTLEPYEMPSDLGTIRTQVIGPLPPYEAVPTKNWHTPFRSVASEKATIVPASLSTEMTQRLVARAHAERTTVFGAIAGALMLAGRDLRETWRSRPVRVLVPIDLRLRLGLTDQLMLAVATVPVVSMPELDQPFWQLARTLRSDLLARAENQAILQSAARSTDVWAKNASPDELISAYEDFFGLDILFTNMGRWPDAYESESLRLDAAWGPAVLVGFQGEQGISAVTINGELHLLHVTFDPQPGLLDRAVQLIKQSLI